MNEAVSRPRTSVQSPPRAAGSWPAWLMVIAVVAGAYFAFSHRPAPPSAPTQVYPERLHVNALANVGKRFAAAGEQGRILIADDASGPWREARVEPQRGSTFTYILALDDKSALAVGHDGWIVRSADAGESWKEVAWNTPAPERAAVEPVAADAAEGASAETKESTDDPFAQAAEDEAADPFAGSATVAPSVDASDVALLGIAGPFGGKLFAYGAFGLFLTSTDQGQTWQRQLFASLGDRHINAIVRNGEGGLLAVGERGLLARSADNGQSWQNLPEIYAGSFYGALALPGNALIAFGMRGNVFASRDGGGSWRRAQVPLEQSLFGGAIGPDGEAILAGASNTILVSTDQGASFTQVSQKDRRTVASIVPLPDGRWLTGGDGGISLQQASTQATQGETP